MTNLEKWENKMKERRGKTPFREFVREITSWRPLTLHNDGRFTSIYPETNRKSHIIHHTKFEEIRASLPNHKYNFDKNFFVNFSNLLEEVSIPNVIYYGVNENAEYGDQVSRSKNVYLSYVVLG